jgi:hypothetical protein
MFVIYIYILSVPSIFCKRRDLDFVVFYPFGRFENCILFMGKYIRIYWVDGCKGFKKERVTLSRVLCHHAPYWHQRAWGRITCIRTYIYGHIPYRQPPLYQGLRVSKGHRVTGSQGNQVSKNHRVTGSRGHGDARSQGHGVTGLPDPHYHRVTGSSITHAFISMARVSMVTGSP